MRRVRLPIGCAAVDSSVGDRRGPCASREFGGVGTKAYPPFETYVPEIDLPVDDGVYPYLVLVDPYDTTVFSSHQCGALLGEFERLATARPDDPKVSAVLELVRRCADDVATTLWFVGD